MNDTISILDVIIIGFSFLIGYALVIPTIILWEKFQHWKCDRKREKEMKKHKEEKLRKHKEKKRKRLEEENNIRRKDDL